MKMTSVVEKVVNTGGATRTENVETAYEKEFTENSK